MHVFPKTYEDNVELESEANIKQSECPCAESLKENTLYEIVLDWNSLGFGPCTCLSSPGTSSHRGLLRTAAASADLCSCHVVQKVPFTLYLDLYV